MAENLCILVDIDDVCNNLMDVVLEFYNRENDNSYSLDDFSEFNIYNCIPEEDADKIHALFLRKDMWDQVKPSHDAQMVLKRMLEDGVDVYLVTATAYQNATWRGEWLAKYFPFIGWDRVIICAHKERIMGDYLIDDNLNNLKKRPYGRVCMDKPWNRNIRDDVYGIIRVKSLSEAYKAIMENEENE